MTRFINNSLARVALMACVLFTAAISSADDPKDILFYGNSFTNATCCGSSKSVPTMFSEIAVAAGHPAPRVVNAAANGQTLQWHLDSASQMQRIVTGIAAGEKWEHVVLQDYSTAPTHIGNLAQHLSSSLGIYQRVALHSPNVVPVMYETWARGYGNAFYLGGSPSFPGGPAQMQQELRDGYQQSTANINTVAGSPIALLAPAGDAWELANFPANFYGDGTYHASNRGSLLNALVLYGTIYDDPTTSDISLSGVLGPLGLSTADGLYLTSLADAVLTPVPEPAGLMLVGGFGVIALLRRSKQW